MNKQQNSKPTALTDWLVAAALMLVPGAALSQPFPEPDWVGIIRYEAWEGYYPTEVLNTGTGVRTPFNAHVLRARVVMRIEGPERTTMKVVFLEGANRTEPDQPSDDLILVELVAPRNGRFGEGGGGFPAEMGVQYQEMRRTILPPGEYVREGNTPEKNRASIYAQAYEKSRGSFMLVLSLPELEGANADYERFAEDILLPRLRRGAEGDAAKEFEVEAASLGFRSAALRQRGNEEERARIRQQYVARLLEVDQSWPEDRVANFRLGGWFDPKSGARRDEDRDFLVRLAHGARNLSLRLQAIQELDHEELASYLIPLLDDPNPLVVIQTVRTLDEVKNRPPWKQKRIPSPVWNPNGGIENLEEIKRAWKSG